MKNKLIKVLPALVAVIVAGVVFCSSHKEKPTETEVTSVEPVSIDISALTRNLETTVDNIFVYVSGKVRYPGVYSLERGSRVFEAIEMAGGLTEEAADGALNLAALLVDGQQIYVPDQENADLQFPDAVSDGLLNINTATSDELMSLPGIGKSKASAIISYRDSQKFSTIEDIMNVPGIKENLFNQIKDLIKV